jgi:DNA polymerase-1
MPIKNIFTHSNWIDEYGQDVFAEQFSGDDFDYGALVAADFSGIELRVFASIANCETMLKIIESGLDTHKMVAAVSKRLISQDDLEDAANHIDEIQPILDTITKEVRYVYKWTSWTLLYGGDEYTLSHLYDIPLEEAKKTVKIYYEVFPEVLDQLEKCAQFASENGYIESPFGRREYLPYINDRDEKMANRSKREAVNMPMQATASDLTIASIVILDKEIQRRQMYARLCSEVHDSIVGDAPRGEIITYALLVKDVMENIKKYAKIEMPHIDFSWLRCSLKADIEVGTHYGSTIDLDDWIKEYGNAYDQTCKETYHSGLTKAR